MAKTKASFHLHLMVWKINQYVAHGKRSAKSIKSSTLKVLSKDLKAKVLKEFKPSFYETTSVKASNKAYKEKEKTNITIFEIV